MLEVTALDILMITKVTRSARRAIFGAESESIAIF